MCRLIYDPECAASVDNIYDYNYLFFHQYDENTFEYVQ